MILQTGGTTDKATKIAQAVAAVNSARNGGSGGAWTGPGITSATVAAADPAHWTVALFDNADLHLTTFGGQTVDDNSLLLMAAPVGDANADLKVDAFDLNVLAAHWQQASNNADSQGDFNHDGKVDVLDLNTLTTNWQFSGAGSLQAAMEGVGWGGQARVPEPASLGMLLAGSGLLVARSRRRRS